ncbi:hypothetical protein Trydic_g11437 [Trypoxylus dichotomus]
MVFGSGKLQTILTGKNPPSFAIISHGLKGARKVAEKELATEKELLPPSPNDNNFTFWQKFLKLANTMSTQGINQENAIWAGIWEENICQLSFGMV